MGGSDRGSRWRLVALICAGLFVGIGPTGAAFGGTACADQWPRVSSVTTTPLVIPGLPPAARASTGVASLGLGLLGKLPPGNAVISPDSIATALAMAGTLS